MGDLQVSQYNPEWGYKIFIIYVKNTPIFENAFLFLFVFNLLEGFHRKDCSLKGLGASYKKGSC